MTLSREPEGVVMRKRFAVVLHAPVGLTQRLGAARGSAEHLFADRVTGLAEAGREHHDFAPRLRQWASEKKRRDRSDQAGLCR